MILAILLLAVAAFLIVVAIFLGCIAADRRRPEDRLLAGILAVLFVLCAGVVIAGGVKLW